MAWAFYPNLAMDLLIPKMARLIGVENATRLFLLLSQFLIVGGALVLERVVKGRVHLAGFAALMMLYCLPFTWGFLNFEFGLGGSTLVHRRLSDAGRARMAAAFGRQRGFRRGVVCGAFLCARHLWRDVGLFELWRSLRPATPYREAILRLAALAIPAVALLGMMQLNAGSIGSDGTTWPFEFKPLWLFRIMNGYNLTVSAATGRR